MATITCKQCSTEFEKPTKRGRPPVRCLVCRGIKPVEIVKPTKKQKKSPVPPAIKGNPRYLVSALLEVLEDNPDLGRRVGGESKAQEVAKVVRSLVNVS